MASGVTLDDNVLSTYKAGKTWKYIIFGLVNGYTQIGVLDQSTEDDYDTFIGKFPMDGCRWAVYDFEYDSGEGKRSKILFYHWAPETAPRREKMVAATSKAVLRNAIPGSLTDIQANEESELLIGAVLEKLKIKRC